jgi:fumarate hydratase, class II
MVREHRHLDDAIAKAEHAACGLLKLTMGGAAVGTGLNAPHGFGEEVAEQVASMTGCWLDHRADRVHRPGHPVGMAGSHAGLK